MTDVMTNVKTINSAVRTLLLTVIVGGVGFGGWFGYSNYVKPSREAKKAIADLAELQAEFEAQNTHLVEVNAELETTKAAKARLETSLKLLKVDRRMANVEVIEKGKDENEQPYLRVLFCEVDKAGKQIGSPKEFTLAGEKLFIDCWVVTFDDNYVEEGDPLRAASLCVFKSIYGEIDGPTGALSLDQGTNDGVSPGVYNKTGQNDFERQIWSDFWSVCNDPQKQKELGIRASYGQANYVLAEEGRTYKVQLRSSGGASLKPIDRP